MSPTLLLASNPVALRRAIETGGASLAEGVRNLLHDVKEGKLSMVDTTAFAPGRNLALTPGKVVFRNKLIELIQYSPSTETARQIPLMIIPPWINKYYIMDMQPKNSMVRFLVRQGFTVFMLSWRNPDASMEDTTIEDYMDLGPLAASDVVREITGSPTVNVMGYCIGGTLLAMTLAWLAAKGDHRFNSATFMVSLQDFSKVGDTAVFLGDETIDFIEHQMMERGYLDSREMSNMFNLLRSNDLIWSNVVNNYLLGQKPAAFDLLYWNSDGTRMTVPHMSGICATPTRRTTLSIRGKSALREKPWISAASAGHLRGWCREGPYRALGCGLAGHSAGGRAGALCPRLQRPHRRHDQPARRQRHLLGQRGAVGDRRRPGTRAPNASREAGGPTGPTGSPPVPARRSRLPRWATSHTCRCWRRQAVTCWRSRRPHPRKHGPHRGLRAHYR